LRRIACIPNHRQDSRYSFEMCGISAVVSLSPKPLDRGLTQPGNNDNEEHCSSSTLDKSLEAIAHHGPDARDTWMSRDGRVGV
jgi:asparagine synthetase B (glutamine-hydrolysing)